ncbi:MAG TPA: M42 family metallopeptidase [Caproicibacter sp.]|nr:M42 family metallopeptidase [Caproicibacter sp.]
MADLTLLKKLSEAHGISGREEEIRELILKEIRPLADKIEITPLGNIIAFKKGEKKPKTKLMISAHMDEVGLIVTHITDDGLLKFAMVGGIDRRILPGKSVTIGNGVHGVIGVKPIHMLTKDEREKSVPLKELYIDIGALSREEAEEKVKPGDDINFDSIFDTANGMIKGKALDDRAGCAILIDVMKSGLKYDATFVFAVQEEVGLSGAKTAAYSVKPDAAIVVESTTAADVPGVDKDRQVCRLGAGPVISFMDRRTIYDREYYGLAFAAAKKAGVKCQAKQAIAGGNDAGAIHTSRGGVRTIAVSLPCRYLHSPVGMITQDDFLAAPKLIAELAEMIAEERSE